MQFPWWLLSESPYCIRAHVCERNIGRSGRTFAAHFNITVVVISNSLHRAHFGEQEQETTQRSIVTNRDWAITDDARRQREKVGDQTIPSTNIDLSARQLDAASTRVLGKLLVSPCQQRREGYNDSTFQSTVRTTVSEYGQRNNVIEIVHCSRASKSSARPPMHWCVPFQGIGSRKRACSGYSLPSFS